MFAIAGTQIHLTPDWTVLIQLVIFLSAIVVLSIFVFRPVLRILDRRARSTSGAEDEAQRLETFAKELEERRQGEISQALTDAGRKRKGMLARARDEAERIISSVREDAKRLADSADVPATAAQGKAAVEMERQAQDLAAEIVARMVP